MKKETRFSFRVHAELKKELERIAAAEGRSVAQVCEAFLRAGLEGYKKGGPAYIQRVLAQAKRKGSE